MCKKEDKILFFIKDFLNEKIHHIYDPNISTEHNQFVIWFGHMEWQQLNDEEKQKRRKGQLLTARKWSRNPLVPLTKEQLASQIEKTSPRHQYASYVVQIYDLLKELITKIESKIEDIEKEDIALIRFIGFLYIEKELIDRTSSMFQGYHIPSEIFTNLIEAIAPKYREWKLEEFKLTYSNMYKIWVNEINQK